MSDGADGDIIFSKDFLKASGASLSSNETASAWDPKGANLQNSDCSHLSDRDADFSQEAVLLKRGKMRCP